MLTIVTGGFGSGKSEYSLNLALQLSKTPPKVLVDLDLVNAYFRSREARALLESHDIKLIAPYDKWAFSDLPIAGPGVSAIIKDLNCQVILDVGGDSLGANALGSYQPEIAARDYALLLVVNPYRPFTQTVQEIIAMKEAVEQAARLTVTALISNPNTGAGTTLEQLKVKHFLVMEAAWKMQLPVQELVVLEDLYITEPAALETLGLPLRLINIYLSPQWLVKQLKNRPTGSSTGTC